jgi:tetratricopeptide (TPR) repeat protein
VRSAAEEALGDLHDTRAVDPLILALKDNDSDVRRNAARALGNLGDTRAIEPLKSVLNYEDYEARYAAEEALNKLQGEVEPIDQNSLIDHAMASDGEGGGNVAGPISISTPSTADDWYNKGRTLQNQSKYDDAIKAYDEAIRLDPKDPYYRFFKGYTLYDQGKYGDAIQALDESIHLNPEWSAWLIKSLALRALGRTTEADTALAKAKELGYTG